MANCRSQPLFVKEIVRENPYLRLRMPLYRFSSDQFFVVHLSHHHFVRLVYFSMAKPLSRQGNVEKTTATTTWGGKEKLGNTLGVKWIDDYINVCICFG